MANSLVKLGLGAAASLGALTVSFMGTSPAGAKQVTAESAIRQKISNEELQERYARGARVAHYLSRTDLSEDDLHTISRDVLHDDVPCYRVFTDFKKLAVCEQSLRITFGIDRDSPKGDEGPEAVERYFEGLRLPQDDRVEITAAVRDYKGCQEMTDPVKKETCEVAEKIWYQDLGVPPGMKIP